MLASRFRQALAVAAVIVAGAAFGSTGAQAVPTTGEAARKEATTRLFNAVYGNDFTAVQASVGAGADIEARNSWGITAADLAVDKGYFRIAHYLVSVRNFQRSKAEPAAGTLPSTLAGATPTTAPSNGAAPSPAAAAKSALLPAGHQGTANATVPTNVSAKAAASSKLSTAAGPVTPATTAATPATTTPATTAPAASAPVETWHASDGPNPFDPSAPAYGTEVPTVSN